MRRAGATLLMLAVLPVLAGCVSWPDRADAEALNRCEGEVDPDQRRTCRETVRAAAEAGSRARLQKLDEEIRRAEEREKSNAIYGRP
ncbi:hypothetical protein [Hyphomonas sp.]|uniref:hypothetical protein n=1 Tax=Hyphomonas sp. TaxID=87 RepID=UPI00391A374F